MGRDEAASALKRYVPDYAKGLTNFSFLVGKYMLARERASQLAEKHRGDGTSFPEDNPSSHIWLLIEDMDAAY
jgi:hypothetical protein